MNSYNVANGETVLYDHKTWQLNAFQGIEKHCTKVGPKVASTMMEQ